MRKTYTAAKNRRRSRKNEAEKTIPAAGLPEKLRRADPDVMKTGAPGITDKRSLQKACF